jgi:hypothetical protein
MEHDNSITADNQIVNFINRLTHTNITLLSVPFRYDLPASLLSNMETESFNRQLMEHKLRFSYVTFSEFNHIRQWFTSHGLHLNKAGKELLANDLAYLVLSLFEDPSVSPVNYGCHSDQMSKTSDSSNDSEVPLNLARKDLLTNRSSILI